MEISDPINTKGDKKDITVNINWETHENSTSNLAYDTSSHTKEDIGDYSFSHPIPIDTTPDTENHLAILDGLEMSKTYYFRILTKDQFGNESISKEYDFEISSPPPSLPGNIVMNEFVPNPKGTDTAAMPNGEWIELYNNIAIDVNVAGWYFTDASGGKLYIHPVNSDNDENTGDTGETIVPAYGYLVVYDNSSFSLNNTGDTISLFNNNYTPNDTGDDILMDLVTYQDTISFDPGKTFARFPDGIGPWIDPDGTPGNKNKLSRKEIKDLQEYTFEACFGGAKLDFITTDPLCNKDFLKYIGMLNDTDPRKLQKKRFLKKDYEGVSMKKEPAIAEAPPIKLPASLEPPLLTEESPEEKASEPTPLAEIDAIKEDGIELEIIIIEEEDKTPEKPADTDKEVSNTSSGDTPDDTELDNIPDKATSQPTTEVTTVN
ncbi:lamin tail domain-containing protein [Patescibacteria group bacterium]